MYTRYFKSNVIYGADDINTVMSRLTTEGVSLFNDTGTPLIDLDDATGALVTNGVGALTADGCVVTRNPNGKYKINKGTAWLSNGECVIFDEAGYEFTAPYNPTYVYLSAGISAGGAGSGAVFVSSSEPPETSVPLATIRGGVIEDTRIFAHAKIYVPFLTSEMSSVTLSNVGATWKDYTPSNDFFSYVFMASQQYSVEQEAIPPVLLNNTEKTIGYTVIGTDQHIIAMRDGKTIKVKASIGQVSSVHLYYF